MRFSAGKSDCPRLHPNSRKDLTTDYTDLTDAFVISSVSSVQSVKKISSQNESSLTLSDSP
jgi:hypothetical protein